MADDLVTRLRVMQDRLGAPNELCREAADRIAAQSARIAELQATLAEANEKLWALGYEPFHPRTAQETKR